MDDEPHSAEDPIAAIVPSGGASTSADEPRTLADPILAVVPSEPAPSAAADMPHDAADLALATVLAEVDDLLGRRGATDRVPEKIANAIASVAREADELGAKSALTVYKTPTAGAVAATTHADQVLMDLAKTLSLPILTDSIVDFSVPASSARSGTLTHQTSEPPQRAAAVDTGRAGQTRPMTRCDVAAHRAGHKPSTFSCCVQTRSDAVAGDDTTEGATVPDVHCRKIRSIGG